jgi:RHS repeat-associated protein
MAKKIKMFLKDINMKKNVLVLLFLCFVGLYRSYSQTLVTATCVETTTQVTYSMPASSGACCSGTQAMVQNVQVYPDAPYDGNYGSMEMYRDGNGNGNIIIHWNGYWSGTVTFKGGFKLWAAVVWPNGNDCGKTCETLEIYPNSYSATRYSADYNPPSFNGCNSGTNVRQGDNISFSWSPPAGGSIESGPSYNIDGNPISSMPYNTSGLSVGQHTIYSSAVSCGKTFNQQCTINIIPSCSYDNLSTIVANSSLPNATVVDGGYPTGGGYQVVPGITYTINISGITNLWNNYYLTNNGGNDITFIPPNQFTLSNNVSFGSYRFEFNKVNDPNNNCPSPPPFKIYIGGKDMSFHNSCVIVLPDYLISQGYQINDPIILKHFEWTVSSEEGIIVTDNGSANLITLVDGAVLKIVDPEDVVSSADPDYNRNVIENTTYDDDGNVIASARSYFDNQGNMIQTQVKNISDGIIIASNTLRDQYDRPALTTLPAPVKVRTSNIDACGGIALPWENMIYEYQSNFITASGSSTAYSDLNFDGIKLGTPDALSTDVPGTLGWYYSNNNIASSTSVMKEPLVAKTNYPFVESIYNTDGTDEIISIAPPGDIYRSATGHQHLSQSSITSVADNDADVQKWLQMRKDAFPDPQPTSLVENAVKTSSIDQKGVENYTISDKTGKVIIAVHVEKNTLGQITGKTYAFNYYDDAGRLKYNVTPNGVAAYFGTPATAFIDIDKTSYEYNFRGWLLAINATDVGRTEFKYRKDGTIRFSQNAEQRATSPQRYSYSNYDMAGRIVEVGEYTVNNGGITWSAITSPILESRSADGGLIGGTKAEIMKTYYDGENGTNTTPYTQNFTMGKISCTTKEGDTRTWYSYDERGRVVWTAQELPVIGVKKIEYTYDHTGNVKEVAYQRGVSGEEFYHVYEYDDDIRLKKVYTTTLTPIYANGNLTNGIKQAEYDYYLHGPLKRIELADNLQGIDYLYTVEGWLKSINSHDKTKDPGADGNDVFGMSLLYYSGDYIKSGVTTMNPLMGDQNYNGTITASFWDNQQPSGIDPGMAAYAYEYDSKYQLKDAFWSAVNNNILIPSATVNREGNITYDPNGNIQTLQRYDNTGNVTAANNFNYNYLPNKNQLTFVANVGSSPATNYASYQYNMIGQMKSVSKGSQTSYPHYNTNGLIKDITTDEVGSDYIVQYFYGDNGLRYKKATYDNNGLLQYETYYVHDASGNIIAIYDNNNQPRTLQKTETYFYGTTRIGMYSNNDYTYELTDYLGSTRAVVRRYMGNLDVVSSTDYYPYGKVLSCNGSTHRYGYQGRFAEKDEETKWNAFELRMYDAAIGRWMGIDPYRQFASSYMGMGNNPVNGVDPDGGGVKDDILINTQTGERTVKPTEDNFDRYFYDSWNNYVGFAYKNNGIAEGGLKYLGKNKIEVYGKFTLAEKSWAKSTYQGFEGNSTYSSLQGENGFYNEGGWQTLVLGPAAVVLTATGITYAAPAVASGYTSAKTYLTVLYLGEGFPMMLKGLHTATTSGLNPQTSLVKFSGVIGGAFKGTYDYLEKNANSNWETKMENWGQSFFGKW